MGLGPSQVGTSRHPPQRQNPNLEYGLPPSYEDSDNDVYREFADRYIRHQFIRKVYFVLLLQLSFTIGIVLFFKFYQPVCIFVLTNKYFWWICFGLSLFFILLIVCCRTLRHKFPINVILLGSFTAVESIIIGGATCVLRNDILLMALGITAAVSLALSIFALQTKWDFTMIGAGMLVFVIILIVMGIVAIFVHDRILQLVYASLGTLVFSLYLVYDTQLMLGGKHKYAIAPDEYILAALHLYLDIVMIFMFLVSLISTAES